MGMLSVFPAIASALRFRKNDCGRKEVLPFPGIRVSSPLLIGGQ